MQVGTPSAHKLARPHKSHSNTIGMVAGYQREATMNLFTEIHV
jgi:hypothetical protein